MARGRDGHGHVILARIWTGKTSPRSQGHLRIPRTVTRSSRWSGWSVQGKGERESGTAANADAPAASEKNELASARAAAVSQHGDVASRQTLAV